MPAETFEVTAEHIRLLRSAYVEWQDCETGAPAIDPKRPYGNSDVAGDVNDILGAKYSEDDALAVHLGTQTALQIILSTGMFRPGKYRQKDFGEAWKPI